MAGMYYAPMPIQKTANQAAQLKTQAAAHRRFSTDPARAAFYAKHRQERFSKRMLGCTIVGK